MATASTPVTVAYFFAGPERLHVWDQKKQKWVSVLAVSGGGRGQKINGVRLPHGKKNDRLLTSLDYHTKTDAKKHVRGGPLPPGYYKMHRPTQHAHLGQSSYLEPSPSNEMYGRDQFFIHGAGTKGSDGCIVPGDSSVLPVLALIEALYQAFGANIYLKVIATEVLLAANGPAPGSGTA